MKLIVFSVLFVISTHWVSSQSRNKADVDGLCKRAMTLPVERGVAAIINNLYQCKGASNEKQCMMKMYFTAGYLYQLAANQTLENKNEQLEKALAYYERAHYLVPDEISVLNNLFLVHRELGNWHPALNILDQSIEQDPAHAPKYEANKGDILYETKDFRSAAENYKAAFFADVNNEGLVWKVFNALGQLPNPATAFEAMMRFSEELRNQQLNDLARSGFLYALKDALSVKNEEMAIRACVKWAETVSNKHIVSSSFAEELPDPKNWPSVCNVQLQALLNGSYASLAELEWWTADVYRRQILASILFRMESAALLDGNSEKAVRLLETALKVSPEFHEYEGDPRLKGYLPVKMNIAIELGRLFNRYPEMDLNHVGYDRLVHQLFNEKSMHYLQNDLEAIQWSHTMLGLIYADRDVWTSDWNAANGVFQLEHAIEFQKKIQAMNPEKFKPIPSLYQLLAKGYKATNQPKKEYRSLVDAAAGYLDLDNLTMANSLVKKLEGLPVPDSKYQQKLKEIGQITSMRFNIRNGGYNFKTSDVKSLENTIKQSDVFKNTSFQNDQSFINRQRFKIMADMGNKCSELNPSYTFPVFEVKALTYIDQEKALGNYQDINRFNQIEGKFKKNLAQDDGIKLNKVIRPKEGAEVAKSKTWSLNSGDYQTQIEVSNDLFVAGKIYENIGKDSRAQGVGNLDEIRIRKGEVTIPQELKEKEMINENKINQIKGVDNVRIINKTIVK